MRTRGQFSNKTSSSSSFNYQSHNSLNKFRKTPVEERTQEVVQEIFKVKLRGQQPKQITKATLNKEDEVKELKRKVKILEGELKKKLLQNPILSRLLKTKHNQQLSHYDLYVEFVGLKQADEERIKESVEAEKRELLLHQEITELKQKIQRKQQHFIEEIEAASGKISSIKQEFGKRLSHKEKLFEQETIERQGKIEELNMLIDQLQAKNHKLSKSIKQSQLEEQTEIEELKAQHTLKAKEFKGMERALNQQIRLLKDQVQKLASKVAEKQLQIEELDRFIELERQSISEKISNVKLEQEAKVRQEIEKRGNEYKIEVEMIQNNLNGQVEELKVRSANMEDRMMKRLTEEETRYQELEAQREEQISQSGEVCLQLSQEIAKISQQLSASQLLYESTQNQLKDSKSAMNHLMKQKEQLLEENKTIQQKSSQLEKHIELSKSQLMKLSYKNDELEQMRTKGKEGRDSNQYYLEGLVEELERKVYLLSVENKQVKEENKQLKAENEALTKMKGNLERKENTQVEAASLKGAEENFISIGRIKEINHKIRHFLEKAAGNTSEQNGMDWGSDLDTCHQNGKLHLHSRSRSKFLSTVQFQSIDQEGKTNSNQGLLHCLETLSGLVDMTLQLYFSLQMENSKISKHKLRNDRQTQSILNHLVEVVGSQPLYENMQDYLQVGKQKFTSDRYINKKQGIFEEIIESLIQLKVIKSYSSKTLNISEQTKKMGSRKKNMANTDASTDDPVMIREKYSDKHLNEKKNSLKNLMKVHETQYSSNQQNSQNLDSLEESHRRMLFENGRKNKSRSSIRNSSFKLRERFCTQPADIDQQSTYEVQDENFNADNFNSRNHHQLSRKDSAISGLKQNFQRKYKEEIKDRLNIIRQTVQLSKTDIENKYFR